MQTIIERPLCAGHFAWRWTYNTREAKSMWCFVVTSWLALPLRIMDLKTDTNNSFYCYTLLKIKYLPYCYVSFTCSNSMWTDKAFVGTLQEADSKTRTWVQEVHFGGQTCGHMEITGGLSMLQACLGRGIQQPSRWGLAGPHRFSAKLTTRVLTCW